MEYPVCARLGEILNFRPVYMVAPCRKGSSVMLTALFQESPGESGLALSIRTPSLNSRPKPSLEEEPTFMHFIPRIRSFRGGTRALRKTPSTEDSFHERLIGVCTGHTPLVIPLNYV